MEFLPLLLIGVGLSTDAFSLALCYGSLETSEAKRKLLSLLVGSFHFFMPLFGIIIGDVIEHSITVDIKYIVFLIFMLLGVDMIISTFEPAKKPLLLNKLGLFLFALAVSIDSFLAGIGIHFISNSYILSGIIFAVISSAFTYTGMKIGGLISIKHGNLSKLLGGLILIAFAFFCLFK